MAVTFRNKESFGCGWSWYTLEYPPFNTYRRYRRVETQWQEVAYEGAVLKLGQESVRIMSDVWGTLYYALVWEADEPRKVTLEVVDHQLGAFQDPIIRAFENWEHTAEVDATDEVKAAYQAWQEAQAEAQAHREHEENQEAAFHVANQVRKGAYVELNRKRCKVPYGTRGHVFWTGDSRYGERVGFRGDDGETYWTALRNVSVVPGHENWEDLCETCGGEYGPTGWVPANDGKGGHAKCPECTKRYQAKAKAEAKAKATPAAAPTVERGDWVTVTKGTGRDAPAGVTGKVFWVGASKFGPGDRVGLKTEEGETFWAAADNVQAA
jgi:hypothetical protein